MIKAKAAQKADAWIQEKDAGVFREGGGQGEMRRGRILDIL